ncbi:uncharacterized protein J4E88_004568 [Alternaria novae-zelandiae]|uniref:uncharacterized protein n=1 Tax=Alternaria novae-zelandiae TaxID=430562 RepID=UPI0020C227C6|nr:uncharacterized protein J4E88_004568 [Alternaria novae-zelandiae]KAI4683392.1 hypothetical protein J4E88_004568 [Alternaria novae-zelandiae]
MAATVVIDIPAVIELEAVPDALYGDLPEQQEKVTPASPMSDFRTTAESEVSTRIAATQIARVLHAQYGLLAGGVTTADDGITTRSTKGRKFMVDIVPQVERSLFTEKYGPKSFVRNYVLGKLCTLNCQYAIIDDPHETMAQAQTRQANAQAYTDAITTLQTKWYATYEDARTRAENDEEKLVGDKLAKAMLYTDHYKRLRDNVPQPQYSVQVATTSFTTRQAVDANMNVPLYFLPKRQRVSIWVNNFNNDVFTTFFGLSREILDLRRLRQEPEYRSMWSAFWGHICDNFHRMLVGYDNSVEQCRIYASDVRVRHNAKFPENGRTNKAYDRVRNLAKDLDKWGDWKQTPILNIAERGFKRKNQDPHGPSRPNPNDGYDFADDLPE